MTKIKTHTIREGGITLRDAVAGLVDVDEWSGTSMVINVELLIDAMGVLKKLSAVELIDMENVHIGIDKVSEIDDASNIEVFYMFFNQDKKKAYAIAGKMENDSSNNKW